MYYMYIDKVLFPVTPSKISIKIGNQNKTVTLINESEVNLVKSPGLSEITIDELVLPLLQKYPFAVYEDGEFKSADYFLGKLEEWKKSGKAQTFILSRVSPGGGTLLFDTNMSVTIEDYEIREDAQKYGMDIAVKLTMRQYVAWGAKKLVLRTKKKSGKKSASKKKTRKNTKAKAKSYTVKKGDTLLKIARKQLDDGSKRKQIYKLNKAKIEKAAKNHGRKSSSNGRYLYAGTKLKLPSS